VGTDDEQVSADRTCVAGDVAGGAVFDGGSNVEAAGAQGLGLDGDRLLGRRTQLVDLRLVEDVRREGRRASNR
jgi:hypothetical protein